jgi:hypothetical protein
VLVNVLPYGLRSLVQPLEVARGDNGVQVDADILSRTLSLRSRTDHLPLTAGRTRRSFRGPCAPRRCRCRPAGPGARMSTVRVLTPEQVARIISELIETTNYANLHTGDARRTLGQTAVACGGSHAATVADGL